MKLYGAVTQQPDGRKAILGKDGTIWQTPEVKDLPVGMPVEFNVVSYEIEVVAEVYARTDLNLFCDLGQTCLAAMMPDQLAMTMVPMAPTSELHERPALVYTNDRNTEVTDQVALQMLVDRLRAPEKPVIEVWMIPPADRQVCGYYARLRGSDDLPMMGNCAWPLALELVANLGEVGMSPDIDDYRVEMISKPER